MIPDRRATKVNMEVCKAALHTHQAVPRWIKMMDHHKQNKACLVNKKTEKTACPNTAVNISVTQTALEACYLFIFYFINKINKINLKILVLKNSPQILP